MAIERSSSVRMSDLRVVPQYQFFTNPCAAGAKNLHYIRALYLFHLCSW